MSMLQNQIRTDIKEAMKAKEEPRLTVLRGVLSAFTQELTATKRTPQDELNDEEATAVIRRLLKQRKDAAEQFTAGNRPELAENEMAEAKVLEEYLPQMMSQDEIKKVAIAKKEAMGVTDKSAMGKLMGAIMGELKGKADGGDVKVVVESLFE